MPYIPERKPEEPAQASVNKSGNNKQPGRETVFRRIRPVLVCVFALAAVYGAVRLAGYGLEYAGSRETGRELQALYRETEAVTAAQTMPPEKTAAPATAAAAVKNPETPVPEEAEKDELEAVPYPDNPDMKVPERFRRLRKKSSYIIGWLSLDNVDEAVAWKDNTYFLKHDATGKRNSNGAIFLEEDTNLLTRPYTLCLYGHNMKNGNMFGRLKKYLNREYLFRHRIVTFDSMYENGQFAVFAAAEISTVPGTARYYDLWSLHTQSREARKLAISRLIRLAACDSMLDVRADEQILLLVTCIGEDTDRLVVAARRLREGEAENQLVFRK